MALFRNPPVLPLLASLTIAAGLAAPSPARAAQGQGELAQAPLVNDVQIPPAFIMAVDDSGSMTFETLFPNRDGMACSSRDGNHRFYDNSGNLLTSAGTSGSCNYHHLFPFPGHRIGTNRYAIPPLDSNGFARSPEINPQYFDPGVTYVPWIDQNLNSYPDATTTATRADPRDAGPTFNMTAEHRDRTDDAESNTFVDSGTIDLAAGDWLEAGWQIRNSNNDNQSCSFNGSNVSIPRSNQTALTIPAGGYALTGNCTSVRVFRPNRDVPASDEMFLVPRNTVLPAGTWYFATGSCGGLGSTTFRQNYWTRLVAPHTLSASCTLGIEYFPATFYLGLTTPAPDGYRTANRVLAEDACGPGCDMYRYEIRPANYTTTTAYNAAIQNFANWFSFYGSRNRAMVAGMTRSLAAVNNMYVGYFTINNRVTVTMRNMANAADKTALYTAMLSLEGTSSTPNRHAVAHMGAQFRRTGAGAPIRLACQKNAGMLFTDGYSNQDGPAANPNNADGSMGSPFADSHSNTLADLAAEYYLSNLRPDLTPGLVPTPDACNSPPVAGNVDCRKDPHMNFYGITLGAKGYVYGVDMAATNDPFANPPAWRARANDDPSTVDEIWHAALNARGRYINAQSPEAITTAMREILDAIGEQEGPSGTIALSGARVGSASLTVQPSYGVASQGTDWYGDLAAQQVTVDANGQVAYSTLWTASSKLPAPGSRNIRFAAPSTSVNPTVAEFTGTNVGNTTRLCASPLAFCAATEITSVTGLNVTLAQAVDYLRGVRTLEGTKLRVRTSPLGDIVNSTPVISAPTDDFGYRSLRGTTVTQYDPWGYQAYLTAKASRPRTVYVGANDGMLHAFHGTTGVEQFAFIPSTSLGHMGNLLFPYDAADANDQRFQHRYFVDGPLTVTDARISGNWRTMLVGTGGAGGKGLFALNVSTPASFTNTNVMWEISPTNSGHGEYIGNILGKPVVVPTREGTSTPVWKTIVGNGYDSQNGTAQLLVIDAGSGTVTRIPAVETAGAGVPTTPNGLGSVAVVDQYVSNTTTFGRDGYADTAYAGDLHGNIWKFDLRNNSLANGGKPVFTASVGGVRQPITGGIEVSSGPGGGLMIYFGTGSYAFADDPSDASLQSVYAFLDKAPTTPTTYTRANLAAQTIVAGAALNGQPTRTITSASPNYVTQSGWYMDLAVGASLTGERFVANPRLQSGQILFVTFEPAGGVADPCDTTGTNWLYAMNATSGAPGLSGMRLDSPTGSGAPAGTGGVELDTDSDMPIRDLAVLIVPPPGAVDPTATQAEIDAALARTCDLVINVAGAPPMYLPRACGRQSWRQVR